MIQEDIYTQNTPPLPTGSSRSIQSFSRPLVRSAHVSLRQARLLAQQICFCGNGVAGQAQSIALHLLTAYLPPPPNCRGTVPLKNFYLCLSRLKLNVPLLFFFLSLFLSFSSCTRHPAPVTEALRHAGPKRQGLKQLLQKRPRPARL